MCQENTKHLEKAISNANIVFDVAVDVLKTNENDLLATQCKNHIETCIKAIENSFIKNR